MVLNYRMIFSFDFCYDCLILVVNFRVICMVLSFLEGLDLNGEFNNVCWDILDFFLRMFRGLSCSFLEVVVDFGSLVIFIILVCFKMCFCE